MLSIGGFISLPSLLSGRVVQQALAVCYGCTFLYIAPLLLEVEWCNMPWQYIMDASLLLEIEWCTSLDSKIRGPLCLLYDCQAAHTSVLNGIAMPPGSSTKTFLRQSVGLKALLPSSHVARRPLAKHLKRTIEQLVFFHDLPG